MQTHIEYQKIAQLFEQAYNQEREFLYEYEVYKFIEFIGGETPPKFQFLPKKQRLTEKHLSHLPTSKLIVKIVSPYILHKSDIGGVAECDNDVASVLSTIRKMSSDIPLKLSGYFAENIGTAPDRYLDKAQTEVEQAISSDIQGYLLCQHVEPDSREFGNELLISLRNTREFGVILSAGLGGRDTELFASRFKKGQAIVSAAVELVDGSQFFIMFQKTISYEKLAGLTRGQKRIVTDDQLRECFEAMLKIGRHFGPSSSNSPYTIEELEVNPFAFSNYLMMPLDGLCKFSKFKTRRLQLSPSLIGKLLHPKQIGILGVSATKSNIGSIILDNILANGYPKNDITLLHPSAKSIHDIRTLPDIKDIPTTLDLLIISVEGSKLPDLINTILERNIASAVILISAGLGESSGEHYDEKAIEIQADIQKYRSKKSESTIFLGGNSLGVLSHPGKYDALFIPDTKLPKQRGTHKRNTAIISQSGAYMITRMSKLAFLDPAYAISIGNQLDIGASDILKYFNTIDTITSLAFYIEGFTDLDGFLFAKEVEHSVQLGKEIIFYKAGRTQEGKDALSGHTASIAGDYMVCESCISQAGAIVAETFNIFEGLLRLSSTLSEKIIQGNSLAAISNAGYEAVGIADNIIGDDYTLVLTQFEKETTSKLSDIIHTANLEKLTSVANPLDVTPMASETVYLDIVETVLLDEQTDIVVVAIVPLTPMLHTLISEGDKGTDTTEPAILHGLKKLNESTHKPIVVVVDSGQLYDPIARGFEAAGIPVFRSADLCVTVLGKYVQSRLTNNLRRQPDKC